MSREQLTELQRRCIEVIDRLGGAATARQVADVIGVRSERVLDALKAMSDIGFVVKSKANGSSYVFSAIKSVPEADKESVAKTRTVVNASSGGTYDGADLRPIPGLPQSRLVAFSLPSRFGNRRYHKDGRVEVIE